MTGITEEWIGNADKAMGIAGEAIGIAEVRSGGNDTASATLLATQRVAL